ncbi:MAG: molecular chaperone HscC [Lachnospiraceae bacterium]|nr:molecular chaperone HscC [Lachnospiraceae bacterium]
MSRIIGIDLGTTNSLAAYWKDGESRLIPNAFGEYLTPSVVSVDEDGTIYVGKTAKERLSSHPEQTASLFKRFMGTSRKYTLGKRTYQPEELSALVLKKLKEDAESFLGEPVEEAVISVPAYFNDMARNATKRAGILAGFKVERIINEPSAAALACQNLRQEEDAVVMVFDFGGGTLDVSLVECFDNVIEITAVSGDNQLGGQDFDDAVGTYFIKKCGLDPEKLERGTRALIRSCAEKCKRELTENKTAQMVVNCDQISQKLEISRKDIVVIGAELFERMSKPVKRVLMDGKVASAEIDQIVLVGGSCKMPVVQQYLKHLLNRADIETLHPDYMIALGAGICAGIKERNEEISDLVLTDVCPFSLGTGIHNENEPDRKLMSFIIPRNSSLPTSREETYVTVEDNQTMIRFGIYQGESMYVDENIKLGELNIRIPPRPKGRIRCNVRFTYDINGVLEVNVSVPQINVNRQLVIVNEELGMTAKQVEEKLNEYQKLKINPAEQEENKYVLAWGERLFMQSGGEYREELSKKMQYFHYIMHNDPYQIPKVRKYLTVYLAFVERLTDRYVDWDEAGAADGSWYDEQDEENKEIDNLFKQWDEEDRTEK